MSETSFDLYALALALNAHAKQHAIGELQSLRTKLKGLARRPGTDIFVHKTIHPLWAFHNGGRKELQFNIGIERRPDGDELRHGVAFSFETSQALPSIEVLLPKVRLFNEYLQLYPDRYADMRMWHFKKDLRSDDYPASSVLEEVVARGNFVFLGKRLPVKNLDERVYESVLDDFDRLLPLYLYVESGGEEMAPQERNVEGFGFSSGFKDRVVATKTSLPERELNMTLRHHLLEKALHKRLVEVHGRENVGNELGSGMGTVIDVVVRRGTNEYWYYEIKTALSPRSCLREALGQVLEYSYWPGAQEASRLIICGERPLDGDGYAYLKRLRDRFRLPVEYEQITLEG